MNLRTKLDFLSENGKLWITLPLSRDHKSDDKDEVNRIIENHGRIEPPQLNGKNFGLPRIYFKNSNMPGITMTRSFGNQIGAQIGIICEPEIYETVIEENDKFVVMASNRLWELITNDQVARIVIPYWEINDPEGACKQLVNVTKEFSKKHVKTIDNLIVMVIFFKSSNDNL